MLIASGRRAQHRGPVPFLGVLLLPVLGLVAGCRGRGQDEYAPTFSSAGESRNVVLSLAVHPLHNPERLFEVYGPIVEHLNRALSGARLRLEASRSYEEFERKLYARQVHFALPNPLQTLEASSRGYRVFAKMGDDEEFRGLLIVRKDSRPESVNELAGKVISFPAPTAVAATMQPLWFLHSHGLDVNDGISRLYSGSQESSIMNVYLGRSAAAATWPVPWRSFVRLNPEIAGELLVRWETPPLVNNGLVARDDVPPEIVSNVAELLLALHTHEEGRRLLARIPLSRFEPATVSTYEPVRRFLDDYRRVVR